LKKKPAWKKMDDDDFFNELANALTKDDPFIKDIYKDFLIKCPSPKSGVYSSNKFDFKGISMDYLRKEIPSFIRRKQFLQISNLQIHDNSISFEFAPAKWVRK
jgi:hypothetical protein